MAKRNPIANLGQYAHPKGAKAQGGQDAGKPAASKPMSTASTKRGK